MSSRDVLAMALGADDDATIAAARKLCQLNNRGAKDWQGRCGERDPR